VRYRNLLVLPVIAWLYAPVLARLFAVWIHDPFLSHGPAKIVRQLPASLFEFLCDKV